MRESERSVNARHVRYPTYVDNPASAALRLQRVEVSHIKGLAKSGGPVVDDKINPWFSVEQRSAKLVAVLATRLRMSPQSRRDPRSVAHSTHRPSFYDQMRAEDANNSTDG